MKRISALLIIAFIACFVSVSKIEAQTVPTFPTCLNPQGTIKSSYTQGTHGVPGDYATYKGKDVVYRLTDNTLTQCLCPENGSGIQTNWWKVSHLSEKEINKLKSEGWVYVPSGIVWGLDDAPYVAKNIQYSCVGSTPTPGPGPTATPTPGSSTTTTINNITNVFGLASTGNIKSVYLYAVSGLLLIAAGIYSLRFKKD